MPTVRRMTATTAKRKPNAKGTVEATAKPDVDAVLAHLRKMGSAKVKAGMARFAIPSENAVGIPVGEMRAYAKRLGRSHKLAAELWRAGWYEARMLATFVDEPALVTPKQMDAWCKEFDNWAICDTACFHLFDRKPHAWNKVDAWSKGREEFVKRAAFALLASLTVHDKQADDELFADRLVLVERAADDDRNFVKKAVNWALRSIGKRSPALHGPAVELSRRLKDSSNAAARWVGGDALRELTSPGVQRRLARPSRRK
jgi:3-methyladenine DNA glycosylase AlkD